jgi:hypothetical protein
VAAYLRGDAEAQPAAERVLERLTLPQAGPTAPAPATQPGSAIDEKKLEKLTRAEESVPPPARSAPGAPEMPADLSKADEKLSSLLGDPER